MTISSDQNFKQAIAHKGAGASVSRFLLGSGAAYDLIAENKIIGICFVVERKIIWANTQMCHMLGYSDGTLNDAPVRNLYTCDEDYDEVGTHYSEMARSGIYIHERLLRKACEKTIWCLISGQAVDPERPDSGSIWMVQDISDRKRLEEQLRRNNHQLEQKIDRRTTNVRKTNETLKEEIERRRQTEKALIESRERFKTLFRNAPIGIIVTDKNGDISEVNHEVLSYLGARLGPQTSALVNDESRLTLEDGTTTSLVGFVKNISLTEGRKVLNTGFQWRKARDIYLDIEVRAARVSMHGFGTIFTLIDVSKEKQLRKKELEQQTALSHATRVTHLGQLVSSLAHEIGQPLNACESYIAGLKIRTKDMKIDKEILHAHNQLQKNLAQASRILKNIRSFITRTPPQREPLDLNSCITSTLELLEASLRDNEISLSLELAPRLPPTLANTVEIQQVIVNLVTNSIEALSHQEAGARSITIQTATDTDGRVTVSISDTGLGVSQEMEGRLFEPYNTTKATGLGMGLMICKSILESHQGIIKYIPQRTEGSLFIFFLPAVKEYE